MRRIALSAGHSTQPGVDNGAVYGKYNEGLEAANLRKIVKKGLEALGVTVNVDPDYSVTYQTVALFKKYFSGTDVAIDIHFNASNGKGTGVECFIPSSYSAYEYNLGYQLAKYVSATLGIPNRGVKTELQSARKKLLWMTIPCETVLIEVSFIDHDMIVYKQKEQQVGKVIATTIYNNL